MQGSRRGWWLFACVVILAFANISVYRADLASRAPEVRVLEAGGKGSTALVRARSGRTILVNAGPDAGILRALGEALPLWQRRIDVVILTSGATALAGGLPDVERRYRVGAIMRFGDSSVPYGAAIALDGVRISAVSPGVFSVSSGTLSLIISSTTPAGVYAQAGTGFARIK